MNTTRIDSTGLDVQSMRETPPHEVLEAFRHPRGTATPLGRGHIHATFLVESGGDRETHGDGDAAIVLQRINTAVFPDARGLTSNVVNVVTHLRRRVAGDDHRRVLTPLADIAGEHLNMDATGGIWRAWRYIERSTTVARVPTADEAHRAAFAFGDFAGAMCGYAGPSIIETIPAFHDTPVRLKQLEDAIARDRANRASSAALARREVEALADIAGAISGPLASGAIPLRVAHNDTKVDNVLFDATDGTPLCVVDLDTVMPGTPLHDFGDLVRNAAATAPEDHPLPAEMALDPERYAAIRDGYLEALDGRLTAGETDLLSTAVVVIALELGARFLTDYLEGDRYFVAEHDRHNLERARAQLALARDCARRFRIG